MKNTLSTILFILLASTAFAYTKLPFDSLGVEQKSGQTCVLHKVDKGQTLYSLLRRYHCSPSDFYEANPKLTGKSEIQKGDILKFPISNKNNAKSIVKKQDDDGILVVDVPEATPKEFHNAEASKKDESGIEVIDVLPNMKVEAKTSKIEDARLFHVVSAGETLFQISHKYGMSVERLKQLNKMSNNVVVLGQKLIVERPSGAAKVKKDTTKTKLGPAGNPEIENSKPISENKKEPKTVLLPNAPSGKKVAEVGIAEIIDAGEQTNKYLALHRSAPVGSLVRVKNEANGSSVWVKVIGQLTDAGNQDVLIRVSPKAFEKLNPKDRRIRAEVSYTLAM